MMQDFNACNENAPIRAFIICNKAGQCLVDLVLDSGFDPHVLSGFVSALSVLEKMEQGQVRKMQIRGSDMDMMIISEHDLILTVIANRSFPSEKIAKAALNMLDGNPTNE